MNLDFVPLGDAAKVGILPFVVMPDGSRQFMIYQPKNKNPDDAPQPFQLARGTPEPEDGGNALQTAKREAWEELAIYPEEVVQWIDAGVYPYKDYSIHFFISQLCEKVMRQPEDALATMWITTNDIKKMVSNQQFKKDYFDIFKSLTHCKV